MFINSEYLLYMLPAFLIVAAASMYVSAMYRKWSRVPSGHQINGYETAQRLIGYGGLQGIQIQGVAGNLSDHYDPRRKVLSLSAGIAESTSIAALAVTAHEVGHAMQDAENYFPLRLRAALVPMVNIGSYLGWILIMLGLIIRWTDLAWLGVFAFAGGAVFALATLPVEFNASARARRLLTEAGIAYGEQEMRGINSVLNAAALTYVAGLITAILQLFYFVSLVGGFGGRRR